MIKTLMKSQNQHNSLYDRSKALKAQQQRDLYWADQRSLILKFKIEVEIKNSRKLKVVKQHMPDGKVIKLLQI